MLNITNIIKISKKEIILKSNNKWLIITFFIFFILNFTVLYFNDVISGDYSQTDIRSLFLSLIHLQMYIIPLFCFIVSYDSILGERETGMFDLMISYGLNVEEIFMGKLAGSTFSLMLPFTINFVFTIFYLISFGASYNILLNFFNCCTWLIIIFNFISLYISSLSRDRTIVILLSIGVWIFYVFLYDILFTLITILTYEYLPKDIISSLLLLNPIEIFKLLSITYLIPLEAKEMIGIQSVIFEKNNLILVMFCWVLILFMVLFKKD